MDLRQERRPSFKNVMGEEEDYDNEDECFLSRPDHADKNEDGEEPCVILAGSVNEESDSENTEDGEDDVGEGMTKGEVGVSEQDFEGEHEEHGEGDQGEGVEEGEDEGVHELD